jgi:hypothetical protein
MSFDVGLRTWDRVIRERLQLSSGVTYHPRGPRFGQQIYVDQCFLAREDWRACDEATAVALARNCTEAPASSTVEIVSFDPDLVQQLLSACPPDRRLDDTLMRQPPFVEVAAFLAKSWRLIEDLHPLGYATYPSGFKTVTFDAHRSRFIGLHIDEIDKMPMNQLDRARLRISINLGKEDRHLVFIPISVIEMARLLSISHEELAGLPSGPLIQAFMLAFPDQLVLSVAVAPGEAYIAPTENLIHDGSTMWMTTLDFSLTFLAHLERRPGSNFQFQPRATQ